MIIFAKQLPSHLLLLARAPSCAFRLEGRTIETNKMRFVWTLPCCLLCASLAAPNPQT